MRIVAFSDHHNNGNINVPDGDVLVVAGDICKFGRVDDFDNFVSVLPHKHKIFVAGNHDNFAKRGDADKIIPSMTYLQDDSITIDGLKFYGSPWNNVISMAFGATSQDMKKKWAEISDDTDVLITHMPPYGALDGDHINSHWGCVHLEERIYDIKPKIHIFGHIHGAYGNERSYSTKFFNVALTDNHYAIVNEVTVIDI